MFYRHKTQNELELKHNFKSLDKQNFLYKILTLLGSKAIIIHESFKYIHQDISNPKTLSIRKIEE